MSKKKEELKKEAEPKKEAAPQKEAEPAPDAAREQEIALAEAKKELDAAKAELAETKDRYLRILAEYDNFKKRSVREKEALFFAAKADVLKAILPILDNLDRAQGCTNAEDYRKGVELTLSQFGEVLSSLGIRETAKEGDAFDPNLHEALLREEAEDVPEDTVTQVLEKGYALGDQVIRHAKVKVSG